MQKSSKVLSSIVIAGSGYTGKRLTHALKGKADRLIAISRASRFKEPGVESRRINMDLPVPRRIRIKKDALVCYLIPPAREGQPEARFRRFVDEALVGTPARVVLISTTGVYGDCKGKWVDEKRPVNPQTDRAKRRHAVEQYCSQWAEENDVELVIFRVAGIYGPERNPFQKLVDGLKSPKRRKTGYSNRIHVDDLVTCCVAGLFGDATGVFNVADSYPMRYGDYFNIVAVLAGLPRIIELEDDELEDAISPTMLSYLRESRQIDNSLLLETFSIELQYPDSLSGLFPFLRKDPSKSK